MLTSNFGGLHSIFNRVFKWMIMRRNALNREAMKKPTTPWTRVLGLFRSVCGTLIGLITRPCSFDRTRIFTLSHWLATCYVHHYGIHLLRIDFASPLAVRYIQVPLWFNDTIHSYCTFTIYKTTERWRFLIISTYCSFLKRNISYNCQNSANLQRSRSAALKASRVWQKKQFCFLNH